VRIAHVANFYGPASGGLRTAMHELGRGYLDRGHEYLMVVPGPEDADDRTPYGRRVTISAPVLPRSGGYRVITRVGAVRTVLREYRPDVLEVSDRTTLRRLGGWARQRGIPSTFFAHERADGVIAAYTPAWLRRAAPIVAAANAHNRVTARHFSQVVATTPFAAGEFERIGAPVATVPLGVDLLLFHPSHADAGVRDALAAPDETLLLMGSRLSREKRPELAVEAVRELVARGRRVRLVCAGTGAAERHVRERADGLPVTFLGFVSGRERFARLLATADLALAPGPIETFGLAALEALASGTPVVVNAESALPDVVGGGGASAASSAAAWADAIETLLDSDARVRRERARERAEQLPWSACIDAMLARHGAAPRPRHVPPATVVPQSSGR